MKQRMKKKSNAGASASPTLRQHGQPSLLSSPLFSTTSRSVGEKKSCFSSIGIGSGTSNGLGIRRGVEESGDRRVLDESVFRKMNCTGKEEWGVVVVNSAREEETAELELLETDDVEADLKKRGCPFGDNPVSFSITINGKADGFYNPKRGLHSGCPLSPYLFILCAEVLTKMIQEYMNTGLISGMQVNRYALKFSHLLFADDMIIFGKAMDREILEMKKVLDFYSCCSGQY